MEGNLLCGMSKVRGRCVHLSTGVWMPKINLGTFKLKGQQNVGIAITNANALLGDFGIDTASIYKNEEDIAAVLWQELGLQREEVFLTSKISPYELGGERTKTAVASIRERLKVETIDLVLLHWPAVAKQPHTSPAHASARIESWRALEEEVSAGRIGAIGVSNFREEHLQQILLNARLRPTVNQIELHPRLHQTALKQYCRENHIVITAYAPLGTGELIRDERVSAAAAKAGMGAAELLILWALRRHDTLVVKASTPSHIASIAAAASIAEKKTEDDNPLIAEALTTLDAMDDNLHYCWDSSSVL